MGLNFANAPRSRYAISADGELRWKVKADDIVQSSPAIGPGEVVFFSSFVSPIQLLVSPGLFS